MPIFEWNPDKEAANVAKHGITFDEAADALLDPFQILERDNIHSADEDRFRTIGMSLKLNVLLVVHTDRDDASRIISARHATPSESQRYARHSRR